MSGLTSVRLNTFWGILLKICNRVPVLEQVDHMDTHTALYIQLQQHDFSFSDLRPRSSDSEKIQHTPGTTKEIKIKHWYIFHQKFRMIYELSQFINIRSLKQILLFFCIFLANILFLYNTQNMLPRDPDKKWDVMIMNIYHVLHVSHSLHCKYNISLFL